MSRAILGIISDTHGLLRTEAVAALAGSDHILHAGDLGGPEILNRLGQLARVTAVRGNVDHFPWAEEIPETTVLEVGGISIYILHILERLDLKPEAAGFAAVIYGHSHMPKHETKNGVLYFNPGSAGPKRFSLPVSMGRLIVENGKLKPELIRLSDQPRPANHKDRR